MIFLWVYLTTALFMAVQQWRMSSPHADVWPRLAIALLFGMIPVFWFIVLGGICSVHAKSKLAATTGQ